MKLHIFILLKIMWKRQYKFFYLLFVGYSWDARKDDDRSNQQTNHAVPLSRSHQIILHGPMPRRWSPYRISWCSSARCRRNCRRIHAYLGSRWAASRIQARGHWSYSILLVHRPGEDISLLMGVNGWGCWHCVGLKQILFKCDWEKWKRNYFGHWELPGIVPPYNSVLRLTYLQFLYSHILLLAMISVFCYDVGEILLFQSITQCRVVILD